MKDVLEIVNYQDYLQNNQILYAAVDKRVLLQIRKYLPNLGKTFDLRRSDYSIISRQGIVWEFYFTIVAPNKAPIVIESQTPGFTNFYDAQIENIRVSRCVNSCTAKWLAYILFAEKNGLRYSLIKEKVLNYSK